MTERTLFYAATPEVAYLITRDRFIPGEDPQVEVNARRGGLPGGTAVAITVDDRHLADVGAGRYLVDREHVTSEAIGRAFQPWHADVEPDAPARWAGYMRPDGSQTLRNLLNADTPVTLAPLELSRVEARLMELADRPVVATFDLAHARELHRRLFQDVYPWAGEPRTVNMGRPGGPGFQRWDLIESSWEQIKAYAHERHYLVDASRATFVAEAATLYNAVNSVHAFREGNGRTQREWMNALAAGAGYEFAWREVHGHTNDVASQAAREGDLTGLRQMFDRITVVRPSGAGRTSVEAAVRASRSSYAAPATDATKHQPNVPHSARAAGGKRPGYDGRTPDPGRGEGR